MTREEAIKTFEDILQLSPTLDETGCSVTEAMKGALTTLRPVSREQVEKMWSGCPGCDSVSSKWEIKFCPFCGKPRTDEAVQMAMERLNKLEEMKK